MITVCGLSDIFAYFIIIVFHCHLLIHDKSIEVIFVGAIFDVDFISEIILCIIILCQWNSDRIDISYFVGTLWNGNFSPCVILSVVSESVDTYYISGRELAGNVEAALHISFRLGWERT